MKAPGCRPPYDSLQTALQSAFPLDARRLAVLTALVLAMIQARTVVLYALKTHVQLLGSLEVRYQRLLRFVPFQVPDGLFTRFALQCLPEGPLDLILDRTNWKLGGHHVNILLLWAVWNGFSLPLVWSLLPHGGSSSQATREALMERFFAACPGRTFGGLLADREVIGKDWFAFLTRHRLDPCIRLPATATVGRYGLPVWACFKKLQPSEVRIWSRPLVVYGVALRVSATKNAAGETLYLAHRGRASTNLRRYARRWQAENLHSAVKTRGFNLEDTGLTRAERVSTLLIAVSVAFIWACLTGELLASRMPCPFSARNTDTARLFRLGLDHLQDLLLHPSPTSWWALSALMPRFEG
ncbi:IS4 family transposase [Deinococcus apachensis]|uniref:IS4 family transposase n=1 Tax=Deinococcus apachensis TaxID=309886 RepID=UPI000476082A|nr:IS4 family transposase [Deinococcus apachensis]